MNDMLLFDFFCLQWPEWPESSQEKSIQTCKDSQCSCLYKLKYEKICNPSLIYSNHFVLATFLAKITSWLVSFWFSKINLVWALVGASSSYELPFPAPVLQSPAKIFELTFKKRFTFSKSLCKIKLLVLFFYYFFVKSFLLIFISGLLEF